MYRLYSGNMQEIIGYNPHSALWVFASNSMFIDCTLITEVHYGIE